MKANGKRIRVYDGFFKIDVVDTPAGTREFLVETDAVNILLYDPVGDAVLLVRQPRAAMITEENSEGLITETVAGRFDVKLGPRGLAAKEAGEEAGVHLREEDIILLNDGKPLAISAGATIGRVYLAYAKIPPGAYEVAERIFGADGEGESITRLWIPTKALSDYPCEDLRVFTLIQWFLRTQHVRRNPIIATIQRLLRALSI